MAEILAVTWGTEYLSLRRIPSEGVWNSDAPPVKRMPLERPTRAGRLVNPDAGGQLDSAVNDLFANVDVNVPCWFLLPNHWTLRFLCDPPDLKDPGLILNHLRWESKQRISSDPDDYRISAALLLGGQRYFVCITRAEVISRCIGSAEASDLELAGIGLEPLNGETYTFEHPLDLRDALPLEAEETVSRQISGKKVSPAVAAIFIGVVLLTVGYLMFGTGSGSKLLPGKVAETPSKPAVKKPMTAREAATPPAEALADRAQDSVRTGAELPAIARVEPTSPPPVTVSPPAKGGEAVGTAEQVAIPTPQPVARVAGESPIRALIGGLPANAQIQLLVLSPADLKAEVSGISAPDLWLAKLKQQPGWANASLVGKYDTPTGPVTAVRLENPGWSSSGGVPGDAWQAPAKSAGLAVKGKAATGNLDNAMAFFDQVWMHPAGLSKIYLAPQGANWAITVQ